MADHKFRAFIASCQWSDNLLDFVDFAIDPKRDPELPDATTWEELKSHLVGREAPEHAIESAKHIWDKYDAYKEVVEKKAIELFEVERQQGETWNAVSSERTVGNVVKVSSIGEARRREYRAKARDELNQESSM